MNISRIFHTRLIYFSQTLKKSFQQTKCESLSGVANYQWEGTLLCFAINVIIKGIITQIDFFCLY
jgi:hypothetical protein